MKKVTYTLKPLMEDVFPIRQNKYTKLWDYSRKIKGARNQERYKTSAAAKRARTLFLKEMDAKHGGNSFQDGVK